MSDIPPIAYDALYYERTVRSVANFTRRDAEEFLALAAEIRPTARSSASARDANDGCCASARRGAWRGGAGDG